MNGENTAQLVTPLADGSHLVRGGDLGCARLLVLLRNVAAKLPAGSLLRLETTDPVAPIDLPAWCRLTGHHYRGLDEALGNGTGTAGISASEVRVPRYVVEVGSNVHDTNAEFPWRLGRAR